MLEYLGILGIGWGIKKMADAADAAPKVAVRKVKRTLKKANHLIDLAMDNPHMGQGDPRNSKLLNHCSILGHDDEIILDDGVNLHTRCKRCKKVVKGHA